MTSIRIGSIQVGENHRPLVIAEMSGNHNQSLERALEIVDAAHASGAHALKIQTYRPDTMTLDIGQGDFSIDDPTSLWKGQSLYELYAKAHTPWEWHKPIFERAKSHGMTAFSSPFDATAIDFLEGLDAPAYKIASFENVDLALIAKAARTGKPLIISTGMANLSDLSDAVSCARDNGCRDLILLKCTSTYPANAANTNLRTIPNMRELFGCQVGLSDHTMGVGAAVAAIAFGATVVEKHFTLNRADGGVDSTFSLEPAEMRSLVIETERAWQALGSVQYGTTPSEEKSKVFRRSLYVVEDLAAGDVLSESNLRAIRPGFGLAPKYLATLLGKRVGRPVKRGTAMSWELLQPAGPK